MFIKMPIMSKIAHLFNKKFINNESSSSSDFSSNELTNENESEWINLKLKKFNQSFLKHQINAQKELSSKIFVNSTKFS